MPLITSCVAAQPNYSPVEGITPYPSSSPIAGSSNSPGLDGLKPGILPDTSVSAEEQRLAAILNKQIKIEFPLKLGVLLYKSSTGSQEKTRKESYSKYIEKLKANPDVSMVQEISSSLTGSDSNIEDLRKLAARFQVTTLLIINDSYQPTKENKDTIVTPIDVVSGLKNWESSATIEVFALDILNGVFVSTISTNITNTEKYNREGNNENRENSLSIKTIGDAWNDISIKTENKIAEFKKQVGM